MSKKPSPEKHALPDKKNAPKRSGKKGIGPLDVEKDFDTPVRREPAQKALIEVGEKEKPLNFKDDLCVVHFVDFSFRKDKNRDEIADLEFSLPLEDAHKGRFPREIKDAWDFLAKGNVKTIVANGIEPQNVTLSIAPGKKGDLELVAASVTKASISLIEQKGKGKSTKITRLKFTVSADLDAEVGRFCENNFDEQVWIKTESTNRHLKV